MIPLRRFLIVYLLLGGTGIFLFLYDTPAVPPPRPLHDFPVVYGAWTMVAEDTFSEGILKVLKPTDYLSRRYIGPEGIHVGIYVGYHDGGKGSGGIHSPRNCLPGSGWLELAARQSEIDLAEGRLPVVEAIYQKDQWKNGFLYWFQVRDRFLVNEYALKLAEIVSSIRDNRKDSTFVRISVAFDEGEEQSMAAARRFAADFFPVIQEFIPR